MTPDINRYDFGIIGHQAGWADIVSIVHAMRENKIDRVAEEDIRSIFPFFPPRSLFDIDVTSTFSGEKIRGKYIETFISPDSLERNSTARENLEKVNQAAQVAIRNKIPISTLGGFTSIVLEGDLSQLPANLQSNFTTGNSLTASFIVKGIKEAAHLLGISVENSNLLILGATGDIGSACSRYFNGRVKQLFLVARNLKKLDKLRADLALQPSHVSIHPGDFAPRADIIIAVTSSTGITLSDLRSTALLVDAGYPKNLRADCIPLSAHLFYGGMGYVTGGYAFNPAYNGQFYSFPLQNISHGCVLEAIVLAFERRHESYSAGRGQITNEKIEEILRLSEKHGIVLAPFYNDKGPWLQQSNKTHSK